jgi:hypothetical protein
LNVPDDARFDAAAAPYSIGILPREERKFVAADRDLAGGHLRGITVARFDG